MTRTRSRSTANVSRRRFLETVGLGAAALVTAMPAAGATHKKKPAASPAVKPSAPAPTRTEAEVAKQKASLADQLKTIRAYDLPPGSEQAFVFAAVKPAKRAAHPTGRNAR